VADKPVGHEHCVVCGACLLHSGQVHKCPEPVRLDILAAFILDSRREYVPTSHNATLYRQAEADSEPATASVNLYPRRVAE
jgi:hypothetical protein